MRPQDISQETSKPRKRRTTRWQAAFPLHWDADELLSRRGMLRWTVMASGALFAVTAGIVGLGYIQKSNTFTVHKAITRATDVPLGGVHYFQYPTAEDQAILLHFADGSFAAYSGKCTHLSCAVYYKEERNELLCPCHEGVFDPHTGEAIAGPPQRALPKITIKQDGEMLYAVEEHPR
jgi:nitrite reductase/ring-hydroxylating ferredoxin subunit